MRYLNDFTLQRIYNALKTLDVEEAVWINKHNRRGPQRLKGLRYNLYLDVHLDKQIYTLMFKRYIYADKIVDELYLSGVGGDYAFAQPSQRKLKANIRNLIRTRFVRVADHKLKTLKPELMTED